MKRRQKIVLIVVAGLVALLIALLAGGCDFVWYRDGTSVKPKMPPPAKPTTSPAAPDGAATQPAPKDAGTRRGLFGWLWPWGKGADVLKHLGSAEATDQGAKIGAAQAAADEQAARVPTLMAVAGIALIAAGVLLVVLGRRWGGAAICGIAGAGLLAAAAAVEAYPWLLLILPIAALGVLAYLTFATVKGRQIAGDLWRKVRSFGEVVDGGESFKQAVEKTAFVTVQDLRAILAGSGSAETTAGELTARIRQEVLKLFHDRQVAAQDRDTQEAVKEVTG